MELFEFANCFSLDPDIWIRILADVRLRIQRMAKSLLNQVEKSFFLSSASKRFCMPLWCHKMIIFMVQESYGLHQPGNGIGATFCPGNEVPDWFSYQDIGSSLTVQLHHARSSDQFLGCAFFAVVEFKDYVSVDFNIRCECQFVTVSWHSHDFHCSYLLNEKCWDAILVQSKHVRLVWLKLQVQILFQPGLASFRFYPVDRKNNPILSCEVIWVWDGSLSLQKKNKITNGQAFSVASPPFFSFSYPRNSISYYYVLGPLYIWCLIIMLKKQTSFALIINYHINSQRSLVLLGAFFWFYQVWSSLDGHDGGLIIFVSIGVNCCYLDL